MERGEGRGERDRNKEMYRAFTRILNKCALFLLLGMSQFFMCKTTELREFLNYHIKTSPGLPIS